MQYKTAAFSLVELLIVIVIIGILSAVALPLYLEYRVKSKVSSTFSFKDYAVKKALSAHAEEGGFPNSLILSGTTFIIDGGTGGTLYAFGKNGIDTMEWGKFSDDDAYFTFRVADVTQTVGDSTGLKDRYCVRILVCDNGERTKVLCGSCYIANWGEDLKMEYLPSDCQDLNLHSQGNHTC